MISKVIRSQLLAALLAPLLYVNSACALTWNMPPTLFDNGNDSFFDLAADPIGNAYTVWSDVDTNSYYVSRFSSGTGTYGPPLLLSTAAGSPPGAINVATDASNTALIIIESPNPFPNPTDILTFYYNGTGWVTPSPSPLGTTGFGGFAQPSVEMDGHGNGLAIWRDGSGITPPGDIFASFFNGGSQTWGSPQTLNPLGTGGVSPFAAYSSNGTAVAVWLDSGNDIIATNFDGVSWTSIPVGIGLTATDPSVGITSTGTAVALWTDTGTLDLMSSYYDGVSWGAPTDISMAAVEGYDFVMSPSGIGIAVWNTGSLGQYSLFSGGIWSAPILFASDVDASLAGPSAGVDSSGNAVIAWTNTLGQTLSASLPVGGTLGTPDLVDVNTSPGGNINSDITALSDNGRAFITGTVFPTEGSGVAGAYSLLPGSISGRVCKNKFANAMERVKIITWTSSNPSTVSFNIYRNGKLIANVSASGSLEYKDRHRCKKTDVYTVTSVSASGAESDVLTVSIK